MFDYEKEAKKIIENMENSRLELIENEKKREEHLKGYIFDSLVYRYKLALEEAVSTRAKTYLVNGRCQSKAEAEAKVRQHDNPRDLMAFIRILDEAIGEHD